MEFARGIRNPVAVKLGPSTEAGTVLEVCEHLNPDREPGRLTLVSRMGVNNVRAALRPLVQAVSKAGHPSPVERHDTSMTCSARSRVTSKFTGRRVPGRAACMSS
jgi:3-deoxy-D-arabino-heptulosonate 7-phosphate (DAHP) synthase class II